MLNYNKTIEITSYEKVKPRKDILTLEPVFLAQSTARQS